MCKRIPIESKNFWRGQISNCYKYNYAVIQRSKRTEGMSRILFPINRSDPLEHDTEVVSLVLPNTYTGIVLSRRGSVKLFDHTRGHRSLKRILIVEAKGD
jgi:hypothetical protein